MINIKHGDHFETGGQMFGPDGSVYNFTGWAIASQVRDSRGCLVEALTASWVDATQGLYLLAGSGNTDAWPTGKLRLDVQFTDAMGRRQSTNTAFVNVVKDVTQ